MKFVLSYQVESFLVFYTFLHSKNFPNQKVVKLELRISILGCKNQSKALLRYIRHIILTNKLNSVTQRKPINIHKANRQQLKYLDMMSNGWTEGRTSGQTNKNGQSQETEERRKNKSLLKCGHVFHFIKFTIFISNIKAMMQYSKLHYRRYYNPPSKYRLAI